MKKIFTLIFIFSFFTNASAQCVFDGTDPDVSEADVLACLGTCPCTIEITGLVNLDGSWDLDMLGDITMTISGDGSLVFSGVGGGDEIFLSAGSILYIENTNMGITPLVQPDMGGGNIRITIGTRKYQGNDFPAIIAAGGADGVDFLPVELTSFKAQSKNDMIELSWTTATELNNDFFQIEHSRDGIQFFTVGKVKGEGTTTETVEYNFMHRQPITGTNYYRLKQVDYDGAFEYSDIVVAEVNSRAGGIKIYPNPTINKAVIQMAERPEQIKFQLSNLLGQGIDLQPSYTNAGWEIDLAKLPKGVYLLRMEYDGKIRTKRIIKE